MTTLHSCPACRAPVTLSSSDEGTCYVPQGPAERLDGERCGVCGATKPTCPTPECELERACEYLGYCVVTGE